VARFVEWYRGYYGR